MPIFSTCQDLDFYLRLNIHTFRHSKSSEGFIQALLDIFQRLAELGEDRSFRIDPDEKSESILKNGGLTESGKMRESFQWEGIKICCPTLRFSER
jgi:hypothetical protein